MAIKYAGENALRNFKTHLMALINAVKSDAGIAQSTADNAASAAATAQSYAIEAFSAAYAASLAAWPVGSVIISTTSGSPATTLGGTWTSVSLGLMQDSSGSPALYAWKRTA